MQRAPQIAVATVTALVVLAARGAPAHAERGVGQRSVHLSRAIQAVGDRDYEKASIHLRLALKAGQQSRDDTILIYRLSGEVAAAFGYRDQAKEFFERMLAIDQRAEAAVGETPSVVGPYDAARAYFDDDHPPIGVDFDRDRETGIVTVSVTSDPFHMIHAARLIFRDDDGLSFHDIVDNGGDYVVEVPLAIRKSAVLTMVDHYGNQLTEPELALPPQQIAPPTGAATESATPAATPDPLAQLMADEPERSGPSLLGHWYVWSGVTLAAAGAATYFGMRAKDDWAQLDRVVADSGAHDFSEAHALEQSGRRNQLISNIGIGVAITSAVITTVLIVRGDHHERRDHATVAAAPVHGGAVFACEVGF